MLILLVSQSLPMLDRQAGHLRLFKILEILSSEHEIIVYPPELALQRDHYGADKIDRYRADLEKMHIQVSDSVGSINLLLRTRQFDLIMFEHYEALQLGYVNSTDLRFWQPQARVVVDSIDVEFDRLEAKANITQRAEDVEFAKQRKGMELRTYEGADLVIAISDSDKKVLEKNGLKTPIEVLPLIHSIPPWRPHIGALRGSLLFVGNFELDANVDGVRYFVREVFPLVRSRVPEARLTIVGNAAGSQIKSLASENIDVLGFVPDLAAVYAQNSVAVVPIRWGGGLKGKVVEAMSFGLPVVSTSRGIEGFGLQAGENVMVGDGPESFADAVCRVAGDSPLYERLRLNGWEFVRSRFSEEAAATRLKRILADLAEQKPKSIGPIARLKKNLWLAFERNLLWRFKQGCLLA
jgi:glycosyltransferase involved in cell wall biosynthesis